MAVQPEGAPATPKRELWGPETAKAIDNFAVSGERVPTPVVRWLGRIKAEAARVNAELGLLDPEIAERIARAGDEVASGKHDDQFPIDVFQTGSGTSTNMNANEVIAGLAGDDAHANDHVNMGQSSNDVFPSAVHLAAVDAVQTDLLPTLERLAGSFQRKADEFADVVKAGRTHMMDAVPITLGQEFGGYAAQITLGRDRVRDALGRAAQIPLGGTATGTGLNTHPEFAERVRERLGLGEAPLDRFEAQANRDGLVELHAALKGIAVSLTKIANDLVLMGSGPRTGLVELRLPELQKGSSIMPGKVNPVIPEVVLQVSAQVIGNDTAVSLAGTQGNFELNVRVPMIARNLFESIRILTAASHLLAEKCVDGLAANEETLRRHAESTPAIATALNPYIGYDRGTEIVNEAVRSERTIREVALEKGVDEETLDNALDLRAMTRGVKPGG
ncbi:MAG TPA: class II fumarate hydratase [Thermoleophilaceae bacterium]|nr:class II fumarate hydratase [Thermoleophilaceae bacterium]